MSFFLKCISRTVGLPKEEGLVEVVMLFDSPVTLIIEQLLNATLLPKKKEHNLINVLTIKAD